MHNIMRFLLLAIMIVAMTPQLAEARAGSGGSVGSRGSRTYSTPSYGAAPLSRSTTATPSQSPGYGQPGYGQPGYNNGSPFWRGLAGGFLGAGLADMLFGHGGGYGYGGGGGGFLSLLLFAVIAYFLYRRFSGQRFNSNSNYDSMATPMTGSAFLPGGYITQAPQTSQPILITDGDKQAFEQLLLNVQQAWGEGDLTRLRQFVTPEMLQYFSEELSTNSSRGLTNKMEQVQLLDADVMESWHEYNLDYATARMRFSALDYMVRLDKHVADADYIASGDPHQPQDAQEYWTFTRATGGHWLLSAIQQSQ